MLNRNAYSAYVIDDDLYGTGNKYGILMDKKADEGDANPLFGARYKLNTGMETGKTYNITFTVIDLGIRKQASTGKMFYTCFGLQGEKLGGSSDYVSLDTYISGGYVTTDTINDITVYTITINDYTALKSVDNANFYIYISTSRAAQKFILTGISITDISSGDEL